MLNAQIILRIPLAMVVKSFKIFYFYGRVSEMHSVIGRGPPFIRCEWKRNFF
jgi:hypothetical protein